MIFAKNPVLGKVKTRLAQAVGSQKALEVYQFLLKYTANTSAPLLQNKMVFYDAFIPQDDIFFDKLIFQRNIQTGEDLGQKMKNAFQYAFSNGYNSVVIIGSDCPQISTQLLEDAFTALQKSSVVIGPATDGGYYLLGLKICIPDIFENKTWSTETIFSETIKDLKQLNISYTLLPFLSDIDQESDLFLLDDLLKSS